MTLLLSVAAFIVSVLLLYAGSKKVVNAAAHLASSLNLHKVVVGTVFVATVTSAPEFLSSVAAAFYGSSKMALGNIIGSNIYNIPLIIGICGLIGTFKIKNSTISKECFFMTGLATLLMILTVATGMVIQWIGLIFLALYPAFVYYSIRKGNGNKNPENPKPKNLAQPLVILVLGGAALVAGTFLLVYSAVSMSEIFGLSQFYAGLTIMALGCVVPETAVSVAAALRGEQEISIGNVIGDNIITMTLVFGIVALIRSFPVSILEILTTVPFVILVTLVLFVMNRRSHKITKPWSVLMLAMAAAAFILETLNHLT
ncbi:MAG: sodium:calcium antiporter [Candidatus Bathyarchaeota archaeon]|nr:sodium:calcium antiporter [Candidatus Bathyarchaeota archaeon]MDW8040649.1 sodium:calcium antiporter [Nitrososphaerota archaeon]